MGEICRYFYSHINKSNSVFPPCYKGYFKKDYQICCFKPICLESVIREMSWRSNRLQFKEIIVHNHKRKIEKRCYIPKYLNNYVCKCNAFICKNDFVNVSNIHAIIKYSLSKGVGYTIFNLLATVFPRHRNLWLV